MKFLGKVFSLLIVLFTIYLLCIFFAPDFADKVGKELGITAFNTWVYDLKGWVDHVSEDMLQLKWAGDTLSGAKDVVNKTNSLIEQTQQGIDKTRETIETKVNQVNKVADSFEKTKNSYDELKQNISNLTTFDSGSSSWTGANASSGTTSTGTLKK